MCENYKRVTEVEDEEEKSDKTDNKIHHTLLLCSEKHFFGTFSSLTNTKQIKLSPHLPSPHQT